MSKREYRPNPQSHTMFGRSRSNFLRILLRDMVTDFEKKIFTTSGLCLATVQQVQPRQKCQEHVGGRCS
jgi:hypothetical protein